MAQTTTITVDNAVEYAPVSRDMFGLNCAAWDSNLNSQSTLGMLSKIGVRAFRYPGGSWADIFDWTKLRFASMATTGDFVRLLDRFSADGDITLNYGSGTPQMAAAWAAYCDSDLSTKATLGVDDNGRDWKTAKYWAALRGELPLLHDDGFNILRVGHPKPFGIRWFEIGNECYGDWEQDNHFPRHDPVTYARFFEEAVNLIKSVAPAVQVGAVITMDEETGGDQQEMVVNPRTRQSHSGWTAVLLSALRGRETYPDFVIYHYYPQQPGSESDAGLLHSASSWTAQGDAIRSLLLDYLGPRGASVAIDCTENNSVTGNPGKQTTSLINGLYYADSFGSIIASGFRSLYWWDLHDGIKPTFNNSGSLYGWRQYGDYSILSAGSSAVGEMVNEPYPTFFAMELVDKFCSPGDVPLRAYSSSGDLSAYAVRTPDRRLNIMIVNNQATTVDKLKLVLPSKIPTRPLNIWSYGESQDTDQAAGKPVDILHSIVTPNHNNLCFTLSPYSITVFQL